MALLAAAAQFALFRSYVEREVAWNYVFGGDPTWYTYLAYRVLDSLRGGRFGELYAAAFHNHWGGLLFLEAALTQLVFGASRFGVLSVNMAYYLAAQLATYLFFRRLGGSAWSGLAAWLLLLALGTAFRHDGAYAIADFNFDFPLFCLLLLVLYFAGWSDVFARRGWAVALALLAAVTVGTRLVSLFPLVAVFGALLIYLLIRPGHRLRAINLGFAGLVFIAVSAVPVRIGADAIYDTYLRFLFDPEHRNLLAPVHRAALEGPLDIALDIGRRVVLFDLGWPFLACIAAAALAAALVRGQAVSDESRRLFAGLLVIAFAGTFLMQAAFPVASPHLTRIVAAPLFVLGAWLAAIAIPALPRAAAFSMLAVIATAAAWVQVSFYTGEGRHGPRRAELRKIEDLYRDISTIARERRLTHLAFSVDRGDPRGFQLGALMSFFDYEFERNGRLLRPAPQLGGRIDLPIERADALRFVDRSDFVLISAEPPAALHWPFVQSVRRFHAELREHVRDRLCPVGRYPIEGTTHELYAAPVDWRVSASASGAAAQRLPRGAHEGWHTPWKPGAIHWIEFQATSPVQLAKFSLLPEDPRPVTAPGDFRLEALENGAARTLLEVRGAAFKTRQWQDWDIASHRAARRYRLVITANGGHPATLGLQGVALRLAGAGCAAAR